MISHSKNESEQGTEKFIGLTPIQRHAIFCILIAIITSDSKDEANIEELIFLESYARKYNATSGDAPQSEVIIETNEDIIRENTAVLKGLSDENKKVLAVLAYDLMCCDGGINKEEIDITFYIFEAIGINYYQYYQIVSSKRDIAKPITK